MQQLWSEPVSSLKYQIDYSTKHMVFNEGGRRRDALIAFFSLLNILKASICGAASYLFHIWTRRIHLSSRPLRCTSASLGCSVCFCRKTLLLCILLQRKKNVSNSETLVRTFRSSCNLNDNIDHLVCCGRECIWRVVGCFYLIQ